MLRIGVIGCGAIAQRRHLTEYLQRNDVEIIAVSDQNIERAQQVAKQFSAKYAFQTHTELLACNEIDAVSVCTPNFLHAAISIESMKAGKHVLCEKPMATTLEDAQKMLEVSREMNVVLMIGHNQRFMPVHMKAREILNSKRLGNVLSFRTVFGHSGPENWSVDGAKSWFFNQGEAFAGSMGDLGIHKADLIRWLLDDEIDEVTAMYGTLHKKTNVDDHASFILKMKQGAIGTITTSWTFYPKEDNSTVVYCEGGTIWIGADPKYGIIIDNNDGTRELYELEAMQSNDNGGQTNSGVINHFVDSVLYGKSVPVTGEDGIRALEIIFAGIHAAQTRQIIKL
jgi:predicted dehydrogenase